MVSAYSLSISTTQPLPSPSPPLYSHWHTHAHRQRYIQSWCVTLCICMRPHSLYLGCVCVCAMLRNSNFASQCFSICHCTRLIKANMKIDKILCVHCTVCTTLYRPAEYIHTKDMSYRWNSPLKLHFCSDFFIELFNWLPISKGNPLIFLKIAPLSATFPSDDFQIVSYSNIL